MQEPRTFPQSSHYRYQKPDAEPLRGPWEVVADVEGAVAALNDESETGFHFVPVLLVTFEADEDEDVLDLVSEGEFLALLVVHTPHVLAANGVGNM
jgi:hypothetical protein